MLLLKNRSFITDSQVTELEKAIG